MKLGSVMNIDQDDDHDGDHDNRNGYAEPVMDPFTVAIALCQIAAKPMTYAAALKKLRKIGRDTLVAERKLAEVEARAADTAAVLAEREAELAAREAAIERRETELEASLR